MVRSQEGIGLRLQGLLAYRELNQRRDLGLQIQVYAHSPINCSISETGTLDEVRNFLGEKFIRRVRMHDGVVCENRRTSWSSQANRLRPSHNLPLSSSSRPPSRARISVNSWMAFTCPRRPQLRRSTIKNIYGSGPYQLSTKHTLKNSSRKISLSVTSLPDSLTDVFYTVVKWLHWSDSNLFDLIIWMALRCNWSCIHFKNLWRIS